LFFACGFEWENQCRLYLFYQRESLEALIKLDFYPYIARVFDYGLAAKKLNSRYGQHFNASNEE